VQSIAWESLGAYLRNHLSTGEVASPDNRWKRESVSLSDKRALDMNNCLTFRSKDGRVSDELFDEVLSLIACELRANSYVCSEIKRGSLCKYIISEGHGASVSVVMFCGLDSRGNISLLCHNCWPRHWWDRLLGKPRVTVSQLHTGSHLGEVCSIIKQAIEKSGEYSDVETMTYFQWKVVFDGVNEAESDFVPICKNERCLAKTYELVEMGNKGSVFHCRCGSNYLYTGGKFLVMLEDGTIKPYMKRGRSGHWQEDKECR